MTEAPALQRTYPWTTSLDGAQVTFRLMVEGDRDALLTFARTLPDEDLMFLRTDITHAPVIDEWIGNIAGGRTITVLAEVEGKIAGYGSVHRNEALWTRHVGEMRVLVSRECRGIGLGKRLANEVFAIAKDLGLAKITAQMTTDQRSARQVFEHMGFRPEALLADYAMSREGETHDLLIMSYDVGGFSNEAEARPRRR